MDSQAPTQSDRREGPASQVSVVVVDDHEVVRRGLRTIFEGVPWIKLLGEAATANEALSLVQRTLPDVVILDFKLRGGDSVRLCREISHTLPGVHVVILTAYCDEEIVGRCVEAGAHGFVIKDVGAARLIETIRSVSENKVVLDGEAAKELMNRLSHFAEHQGHIRAEEFGISQRQLEVLSAISEGLSNEHVADRLFISVSTVQFHIQQLTDKLGCVNRVELVAKAIRLGLIS